MSGFEALPLIETVLNDPAASNWLKSSLMAALKRDAVDAANDAVLLAALLGRRADVVQACCQQAAAARVDRLALEESSGSRAIVLRVVR